MKQKYFCELDEEDITKIIADHFNVDVNKVSMSCGHAIVGVGPMEREEHCVGCKIELSVNGTR